MDVSTYLMDGSGGTLRPMKNFRDLPTPCLLLDLDTFEANLGRMRAVAVAHRLALRPHAKTHKCVPIAKRQVERGAIGVCTATIAEAEVMARGGIRGLLITAELTGEPKVARFVDALKIAPDTMLVVDDADNVAELQQAAHRAGVHATVLIDLDIGQNRTGIRPGTPARELAATIARSTNLSLAGICAYAGHIAHVPQVEARRQASREAWAQALETRDLLRRDGHEIRIVSGASTGTHAIDSAISGITELQAGSYIFMDVEYRGVGGIDFAPALTVLATVIHRSKQKAIVDAGLKAFATDRSFGPDLFGLPDVRYEFAGDEHGRLILNESPAIRLGDKLRFITPHCDPNVNLYDRIYCIHGEEVVDAWPIMDRTGGYF